MVAFHVSNIKVIELLIILSQEMIEVYTFRTCRPDGLIGLTVKKSYINEILSFVQGIPLLQGYLYHIALISLNRHLLPWPRPLSARAVQYFLFLFSLCSNVS